MLIREETEADVAAIGPLITDAFRTAPHAGGAEADIVTRLRQAGGLILGLVAVEGERVVGYVAFSAVAIDGANTGWIALGPIAVDPEWQGRGIGAGLILSGLEHLRARGAAGCVLVGDPAYYGRFGFRSNPGLYMAGVPSEYVLWLPLATDDAKGELTHHPAFFPDA